MHACLTVDEIIRAIAEELVELEAMATAVALASSCKTLEDPVLEELWRTQDRLLPLLKSFPSDAWKIERGRFVGPLESFKLFSASLLHCEVFQPDSDESGVESLQKIRSMDG